VRTFFQSKGESVVINGDIRMTVLEIDGDDVTLAIYAPEWLEIDGEGASLWADELEKCCLMPTR